jgi:NitT/TauT family transport system ATP-binding protein
MYFAGNGEHGLRRPALMKSPPSPLLSADHVAVTYASSRGDVLALADFTADIAPGAFVSIVGPSGCGKSTLLRVIAGLVEPTHGSVALGGTPVSGPRRDVGIVFQRPTLLPWRTALDNVLLPIRTLHLNVREGRERARELLELVGLGEFASRFPHELSGGMQQRVAIARGLVHEPRLLLMDEPFAALDALTRESMTMELQRIWSATGKTIVFITHSIPEAVLSSDRVIVLSHRPGRVIDAVDIDLPRPRTLATMGEPAFTVLCDRLRARLEPADAA